MGSDKPLLTFVADEEWIRNVDDFRFENRFQSRAEAIRWLVEWALKQKPEANPDER